ncbi:MAG TPA: HlyC/CorC family transporter [Candidatus Aveggerthella stercoripullorum]|uniref:HlyC/CorC family transporter n=1 Tax=Candidatus Aveggerthella stercoripullorum TaxID=2840688 RepID=A0A9D1D238_9ACTN|nr:HlyC/CorC family transporter [Candidatus Aveggerthella stercoripullorum]
MSPLEVNLLAATIVLAVIVVVLVIAIAATQAGKRFVRELTANMLHRESAVSEDEIKDMVTENEELADDEKRMIHEIIDMGDTVAHEIMTPRADMMTVEDTETVLQAIERMRGTGYSRLPVYHEDHDYICGVVKYKDLLTPLLEGRENDPVGPYAQEAFFVPESKDILPLLSEMQTNRKQMAIVVDEYGGTDGLITIEDIVEEIVGEIVDETDLEAADVQQLSEREWRAEGSLSCDDAADLGWPVEESDDYDTLAGWLLASLDRVPQPGDSYEKDGYRFTVRRMRRRRISTVGVVRLEDAPVREGQ